MQRLFSSFFHRGTFFLLKGALIRVFVRLWKLKIVLELRQKITRFANRRLTLVVCKRKVAKISQQEPGDKVHDSENRRFF